MLENFENNKDYNANLLDEIQFAINGRTDPTVVFINTPNYHLQTQILIRLKERLSEYHFFDIDLTPVQVISLHRSLQNFLPNHIVDSQRITYCVNVFGLENSRLATQDGRILESGLIAQLNYEREIIFRKPNYITFLWADHDFFVQIQRKAPDLWSWVTYFFEFKIEEPYEPVTLPQKPENTPSKLPIREDYIDSLKEKLNHLPLNDPNKSRSTRERLNIYSLLASEYAKYFDYENAEKYYKNAIGMYEKLEESGPNYHELLFGYGWLIFNLRKYDLALSTYKKSLNILLKENEAANIGAVYHQIGVVYSELNNWEEAFENYQKAIEWKLRTGQEHQLGNSYHQIGTVYEKLLNWEKALENFQKAIEWKQKTNQQQQLGATYQHIGRVFQSQGKWSKALEHFKISIDWKLKTKQFTELGFTYFQMGKLYSEINDLQKALQSYQEAIKWDIETGQEQQIAHSYHQIGRIYERQGEYDKALINYNKALQSMPSHFNVDVEMIKNSIQKLKT